MHRFAGNPQLRTQLRHGRYERDLVASAIRFDTGTTPANLGPATVLNRNNKARYGQTSSRS